VKERRSAAEAKTVDEEQLKAITVGEPPKQWQPVVLADYDPAWPQLFEQEVERIRAALGERALQIEHVGSTAVPGLAAKPIIDINLVVADSSDEESYVPDLEAAGYALRIREPEWFKHRMFRGDDPRVNLHVYSPGCEEVDKMRRFRDHLCTNDADRELYERTKRELAAREWKYTQHYADAKTAVITEIMARVEC
jgi:GrpB-like predicted nucleotidyltransferase (UPF0157 family)